MLSAVTLPKRSYPAMPYQGQLVDQWFVQLGPLVLKSNIINFRTPMEDRDQTVSRRSEPNSRTTLIGEQPNPWELLHPRDVMSRHRGAKQFRR
jgi:hypothetical protein